MDPKQNSNQPLDPKLQEVYDRVMGTNFSSGPTGPNNPAPVSPPTPSDPIPGMPSMTLPSDVAVPPVVPTPQGTPYPVEPTSTVPLVTPPTQPANVLTPSVTPQMPTTVPVTPSTPTPDAQPTLPTVEAATDSMSATLTHRTPDTETIQIGNGGSPVAAVVKPKNKGISPVVFIFGAFAFLVVYAVFWVKFFGYTLPFLGK